jgi:hypothetical protein
VIALFAVVGTTRGVLRLSRAHRLMLQPLVIAIVQPLVFMIGLSEIAAAVGWRTPPERIVSLQGVKM